MRIELVTLFPEFVGQAVRVGVLGRAIVVDARCVGRASVHADDALACVQEQVGHAHALIQQSAGVSSQIEDERDHSGGAQ